MPPGTHDAKALSSLPLHASARSPAEELWDTALRACSAQQLREEAEHVAERAHHLSVWQHTGLVPLRPLILDHRAGAALTGLTKRLARLIVEHGLRSAGGSTLRLAERVGLTDDDLDLLRARRDPFAALTSLRSDVLLEHGRPRVLEVNFESCLSGVASAPMLASAYLTGRIGRRVRTATSLWVDSWFAGRAQLIRRLLPRPGARTALLGFPAQGDEGSLRVFELEADYLSSHGLPCEFVPVEEASVDDGALCAGGRRFDVAVRYFLTYPQLGGPYHDLIRDLEHASRTVLVNNHCTRLFTSKALLADLFRSDQLTSAERDLVTECVPWTARVSDPWSVRDGERVEPAAWALDNRERAVLKPFNMAGSRGVVYGPEQSDGAWHEAVHKGIAERDHVVQELVAPDRWPTAWWHLADGRLHRESAPAVIGPFVVDGVSGGFHVQQSTTPVAEDLVVASRGVGFNTVLLSDAGASAQDSGG